MVYHLRPFSFWFQSGKILSLFLNQAPTLEHLKSFPANRLESLIGNRQGQYSIRINKQWRICFRWESGNAYEVEITDYH